MSYLREGSRAARVAAGRAGSARPLSGTSIDCQCNAKASGALGTLDGVLEDWLNKLIGQPAPETQTANITPTYPTTQSAPVSQVGGPQIAPYPAPVGEVKDLQQQINRFVQTGRVKSIPVNGVLDLRTATTATVLLLARASDAAGRYSEASVVDLLRKAGAAMTNPIPFVGQNLSLVTATLSLYGDALGLPKATSSILDTRLLLGAGAAAALFLVMRRAR